MSELKKWPEECWRWTQERPIKFGDIWYLIRKPFKVIRLAHFALYSILQSQMEKTARQEILRDVLGKHWKNLDEGEPLGKFP